MKRVVILHGTMGSPEINWFRWLELTLQKRGLDTWLPALPHADQPSLSEWSHFVTNNVPFPLDYETLIIGHSSGAILSLIVTQTSPLPIGGVVGVSVFHDNSLNWSANDRLFDVDLDFKAIRANALKLLFVHSDTDPYVPLDQARYVADNCQAELVVVPGQGHFNLEQSSDYTKFPRLVDILTKRGWLSEHDES